MPVQPPPPRVGRGAGSGLLFDAIIADLTETTVAEKSQALSAVEQRINQSEQAIRVAETRRDNVQRTLAQVETRIYRSARRGDISQREAFRLNRNANQIRGQLQYSSRNGLSGREFADLQVRVNRLEQRLRVERQDGDGRRG